MKDDALFDSLGYVELLEILINYKYNSCYVTIGDRMYSFMEIAEKILYLLRAEKEQANASI